MVVPEADVATVELAALELAADNPEPLEKILDGVGLQFLKGVLGRIDITEPLRACESLCKVGAKYGQLRL